MILCDERLVFPMVGTSGAENRYVGGPGRISSADTAATNSGFEIHSYQSSYGQELLLKGHWAFDLAYLRFSLGGRYEICEVLFLRARRNFFRGFAKSLYGLNLDNRCR